jgi:hypothetical protein
MRFAKGRSLVLTGVLAASLNQQNILSTFTVEK